MIEHGVGLGIRQTPAVSQQTVDILEGHPGVVLPDLDNPCVRLLGAVAHQQTIHLVEMHGPTILVILF